MMHFSNYAKRRLVLEIYNQKYFNVLMNTYFNHSKTINSSRYYIKLFVDLSFLNENQYCMFRYLSWMLSATDLVFFLCLYFYERSSFREFKITQVTFVLGYCFVINADINRILINNNLVDITLVNILYI